MSIQRHGLSVGFERSKAHLFLSLKAIGKLTHDDYKIITPMLESALAGSKEPKLKVLFDGTELEGWELRAAWDDFKLGVKHARQFEKVAIVGNANWQDLGAKIGSWFVSGEIKSFQDITSAINWLDE